MSSRASESLSSGLPPPPALPPPTPASHRGLQSVCLLQGSANGSLPSEPSLTHRWAWGSHPLLLHGTCRAVCTVVASHRVVPVSPMEGGHVCLRPLVHPPGLAQCLMPCKCSVGIAGQTGAKPGPSFLMSARDPQPRCSHESLSTSSA